MPAGFMRAGLVPTGFIAAGVHHAEFLHGCFPHHRFLHSSLLPSTRPGGGKPSASELTSLTARAVTFAKLSEREPSPALGPAAAKPGG